jgi:hypothetical protein
MKSADADLIAATKAPVVVPVLFAALYLDGGTVRVCSLDRDYSWNSATWLGVGDLGNVSGVTESAEFRPTGIVMTLSQIPPAYISNFLTENYSGRKAKIWLGFFDADSDYAILITPALIFEGLINQIRFLSGETGTIEVGAENELVRWNIKKESRWTNAEQQRRFSGDKGFEFVSQTVEKELLWGGAGTSTGQVPISTGGTIPVPDVPGGAVAG